MSECLSQTVLVTSYRLAARYARNDSVVRR
jgi:hypothetical protein